MALPSSGSISMSQVKAETGLASNSIRDYAAYYNLDIPDSMTEFLGLAEAACKSVSSLDGIEDSKVKTLKLLMWVL